MSDIDPKNSTPPHKRRATQILAPNAELFAMRAGLNPSPEAYENCGATTAHLNASTLHIIYSEILTHIGASAANNFTAMIKDLPSLSAEVFLNMLYTLEVAKWKWEMHLLLNHSQFSSRRAKITASQVVVRDETHYIRTQFFNQLSTGEERVKVGNYEW